MTSVTADEMPARPDEAAAELREQRERMRCFRAIVAHPTWTIEQQIRATLEVGCQRLGLACGRLGRIEDDGTVEVLYRSSSDAPAGREGPDPARLCRRTFRDGRPIAQAPTEDSPVAYLGVPVRVEGRPFGTLCFYGPEQSAPMARQDIEYAELLGCWLGTMIERRNAEELRGRFIEEVMEAQERERRRLARELHDLSGQNLIAVLLRLRSLQETDDLGADRLEPVRALVKKTLEEIRRLAKGLHPLALDDLGLEAAIRRLTAEIVESHPLELALSLDRRSPKSGGAPEMPPAVARAIYRIVQEGLTNVVKHAGARRAKVHLEGDREWYRLLIEDDGRGFDAYGILGRSSKGGLGLHGIRERLRQLGGSLTVDASPGRGTRLVILIPAGAT